MQRVERLHAGLDVDRLARRQPASPGAPRQPEPARHLTRGEEPEGGLRTTERRRSRLHVDRREERAEQDGRAGPDELGERDAGERLGGLLDERRGRRHRRHRAHQEERRDHDHLAGADVLEQGVEHPPVVAERRVDVRHREGHGLALDRRPAPVGDGGHRQAVACRVRGVGRAAGDLVREREEGELLVEVARVEVEVVRLDGVGPRGVELRGHVGEADEPLEVREGAVAADVALPHEGRAVDAAEGHPPAADQDVVGGVPRVHPELARRLGGLFEDERGIEPDHVALHDLTGIAEHLQGALGVELDPDLRDQPLPAPIDRVHGVLGQDLVPRHHVLEHPRHGCTGRAHTATVVALAGGTPFARPETPVHRGRDVAGATPLARPRDDRAAPRARRPPRGERPRTRARAARGGTWGPRR